MRIKYKINGQRRSHKFIDNESPSSIAKIIFSDTAMSKMLALVCKSDLEVGWHGVGEKTGKGEYKIDDIILYPQSVTSTTIEADDGKYAQWITNLAIKNEEYLSKICMHGHSHVNMSTFASPTDNETQHDIIEMLPPDGFYIFIIINKSLSIYVKIVDKADNLIYRKCTIDIKNNELSKLLGEEYIKNVKRVTAAGKCLKSTEKVALAEETMEGII